jgi:hypothetical protein
MDEKELLQAIMDSQLGSHMNGEDNEAWTANEIADMSGMHVGRARKIIKALIDKGYAEVIWVRRDDLRTPLTGTQSPRPGYRLSKDGREAMKDLST